jgi:uncharacterized protein
VRYTVDTDVPVAMPDGTKLMTNLWRPDTGHPVPVLLARTPYGKDNTEIYRSPNVFMFLEAGYALAVQDCRGTFRSEGVFTPHRDEAADGAHTIDWLARQSWCDGMVGMFSGSYLGLVQWQAASTGVPALKAIAPTVTTTDFYRWPWYSPGGALSLECTLGWSLSMALSECVRRVSAGRADAPDLTALAALMNSDDWLWNTPVADHPLVMKYLPWLDEVLAHPGRDEFWQDAPCELVTAIATPALTTAGWYDIFLGGSLASYTAAQHDGAAGARGNQRLIIGPWSHGPLGMTGVFPDRRFGLAAATIPAQTAATQIAFFDRWIKGDERALDGQAPVRIFVMGLDQWRDEPAWPPPDMRRTDYYLDGGGRANTSAGDGVLSTHPALGEAVDRYLYDPRRPVPTAGGHRLTVTDFSGPADQAAVERRDDVLVFSTEVLAQPLEVTGPVSAVLYVSSSAADTDFTTKLVDVFPDGRAILLCEGILRMRYRNSLTDPVLMRPGEVYEITIDMAATSNVFLPGHRLRLEVSSSNFPRYDRNANTGGVISRERAQDMVAAVNHLRHGPAHPSRLILPVIDREGTGSP